MDADGADNVAGTADDNLRLSLRSPAIDAGSNNLLPADTADLDGDGDTTEPLPYDLDGNPRIVNSTVDMGAYEYDHIWNIWFMDDGGAAGNGCTSWADACPDLQTALSHAVSGDEIWVAGGRTGPALPSSARPRSSSRTAWRSTAALSGPRPAGCPGLGGQSDAVERRPGQQWGPHRLRRLSRGHRQRHGRDRGAGRLHHPRRQRQRQLPRQPGRRDEQRLRQPDADATSPSAATRPPPRRRDVQLPPAARR